MYAGCHEQCFGLVPSWSFDHKEKCTLIIEAMSYFKVQFSLVLDGISTFGKKHIYICVCVYSILSLRNVPSVAFEMILAFVLLVVTLSHPFYKDHWSFLFLHLSPWISVAMSWALSIYVVSQAPQHFRSSETQATCDGCFACQPICSVISLDPRLSRTVCTSTGVFAGG